MNQEFDIDTFSCYTFDKFLLGNILKFCDKNTRTMSKFIKKKI